jgi:carbon storage regulator
VLVLSRRPGQAILIGQDIEIVVLETDGPQVRLGVRAPREITVLRRELLQQVEAENRRAAASPAVDLLAALRARLPAAPAD